MDSDAPGIDRLFAGGRHVRLLVAGGVPAGLAVPDCAYFERVVRLVWPGQPGPLVAEATRLPFAEALFDRALMTSVLPKLSAKAELREIWRILSPAGLALLVIKARRRWQWQAPGWLRDTLEPVLADAMFEILDWRVELLPERYHLILVGKRDGWRPAMIGRVEAEAVTVTA